MRKEKEKRGTALITGASSGIGLELARVFAKNRHPLILTAPVESELNAIALELKAEYKVDVHVIAENFENPDAAQDIYTAVQQAGIEVEILVNNAGHGQKGKFWEIPIEKDLSIVDVNIEAVLRLTKLFLPRMVERNRGRILNTASIAGFEPGPLLAVYHASKAFILSFTMALAIELEETEVKVMALCPGATDTDFFPKADMTETTMFQKGNVMAPQDVARKAYKAFMKGDRLYVPGGRNKTLVFLRRVMTKPAQAKMNKKFYEDVKPEDVQRERGDVQAEAAHN